jgi:hypothetical protein
MPNSRLNSEMSQQLATCTFHKVFLPDEVDCGDVDGSTQHDDHIRVSDSKACDQDSKLERFHSLNSKATVKMCEIVTDVTVKDV